MNQRRIWNFLQDLEGELLALAAYIRGRKSHDPPTRTLYLAKLRPGSGSIMFEDYDSGNSSDSTGAVEVAVQLSRFHVETLEQHNTTGDIDIRGLCLSAGDCELLADAHLSLKRGVRYGLLGRNGSGKSTLLKACAKKTIPSFPRDMKVRVTQGVRRMLHLVAALSSAGYGTAFATAVARVWCLLRAAKPVRKRQSGDTARMQIHTY